MARDRTRLGLQGKLTITILVVAVLPLVLLAYQSWRTIRAIGQTLRTDVRAARDGLSARGVETVEELVGRYLTERAQIVADVLAADERAPGKMAGDSHLREMVVTHFGAHGYSMVYRPGGAILFHPVPGREGRPIESETARSTADFLRVLNAAAEGRQIGRYVRTNTAGEREVWLAAALPVPGTDLAVCGTAPVDDVLGPIDQRIEEQLGEFAGSITAAVQRTEDSLRRRVLVFLVLVIAGVVLVGVWLSSGIIHPVTQLTEAVRGVGSGDMRGFIAQSLNDEIGELIRAFVKMKRDLKLYREQITQKQHQLEAANAEIRILNRDLETRIQDRTRELEQALGELKSLDKNKDDFIALISHELRTPLTSINACTEVLLGGEMASVADDQAQLLGIINDESQRLTRLINDVLDIQRMEAGRMPFDFKPMNLVNLVEKSVINLRPSAKKKNVKINLNPGIDKRLRSVRGDYDRLMQVLTNLLSNALKFTPAGGTVHVGMRVDSESEAGRDESWAIVSIRDTGVGIDETAASKVFDKFYQAERIDYHSVGTGLGLTIAKQIVEEHGGAIWFEPAPDRGSIFRVRLPMKES